MEHMANLFPFCRSITGAGTRATLSYFESYFPLFSRIQFPTGTSCFDWLIPNEWNITDCFIEHIDSGQRFLRFSESNLHVVGYSHPMDCVMDYNDLKDKIYTLDGQPDLIPYITSYYSYDWGFCSSHEVKKKASPRFI